MRDGGRLSHLPVAVEYVFVGNERFQPHGAARVQLLRGNADLRAEAEHAAVGKARGGVDVHRRRIDFAGEAARRGQIAGDDALAVVAGIAADVGDGLVDAGNDLYRQ